jgi:ubiquinone/menaquinone biosynthesis C-methylase UbiE
MNKNKHEKPIIWDKLYSKSDLKDIVKSAEYGLVNPEIIENYYSWLKILIRNKMKFKRSLEVGSGTGSYSLILKKLGIVEEVYLLDYSKESLKIAEQNFRKNKVKAHFIQGNAMDVTFPDNFFDLTLSGGLLEHFSKEDALKIMKEKVRVSKYILTQVPISTPAYWLLRSAITLKNFGWPFGYEKPLQQNELLELYSKLNLKIIDKEYHDILTSAKFWLGHRLNKKFNFKKNFLNKLFINELAILGKKIN